MKTTASHRQLLRTDARLRPRRILVGSALFAVLHEHASKGIERIGHHQIRRVTGKQLRRRLFETIINSR